MDQEAIKTLMEWATQIKDGVSDELPKLAAEIVAFELWSSVAWIVLGALALVLCRRALRWGIAKDKADPLCPLGFVTMGMSCGIGVVAFVFVLHKTNDAIKAAVAPRLVIVEKIAGVCK